MKNKKNVIYNLINIIFLGVSILLINYMGLLYMHFSIGQIIMLFSLFLIVHIFKFLRIYLILLEEKMSLKRRLKIYIKTTFVSIILPFKIGDIYKMYSYGHEISNYYKGIIAILIDKFFDAIVLCLVIIPYGLLNNGCISSLSYILLTFLIIILIVYLSFKNTYYYLNKFFIVKSQNRYCLIVLKVLEKLNTIYISAKEMIRGRSIVLLLLTFIIWGSESIFIYVMSNFMNIKSEFIHVINYISDAFFGVNNVLFNNYIYLGTTIFLVTVVAIYLKKCIDGGRKVWKNK